VRAYTSLRDVRLGDATWTGLHGSLQLPWSV